MIALRNLQHISRADFLTGVGLHFLSDRLVMARLRKSLLHVTVLEQEIRELPETDNRQAISELTGWVAEDVREIALKAVSDSRERALRQALLSLLPHLNPARDAVYLCVPPEQTVVQEVFLPLAAQENIAQVLEYELERQLPFKRDDIYYDFIPVGKKGERFSVYVFAVPKKDVDGILSLLDSLGIKVAGVETTITALANYLFFTDASDASGAVGIVTAWPRHWEMIGFQTRSDGWQPDNHLLFCSQMPAADWAQATGKELLQENMSLIPKVFRCGDLSLLNGLAHEHLAGVEDLAAVGSIRLKGTTTPLKAEMLPAVGAALRGIREASFSANLLRHEGNDRDRNKGLSLLNLLLLGLLLIALTAWGVSYPIKDELRLRQVQNENRKIEPAVNALQREESQLEQLRKQARLITELEQRRGETLRVLDELSKIVPNSVYFSNLRYRAGSLEVQGNAENASTLIPLLERSPVFENVAFNAPSNRGRDNRETFSLKADLEKPKPSAAGTPKETVTPPTKETAKPASKETKAPQ
jgi:Tfp pilus assembly protein PilN